MQVRPRLRHWGMCRCPVQKKSSVLDATHKQTAGPQGKIALQVQLEPPCVPLGGRSFAWRTRPCRTLARKKDLMISVFVSLRSGCMLRNARKEAVLQNVYPFFTSFVLCQVELPFPKPLSFFCKLPIALCLWLFGNCRQHSQGEISWQTMNRSYILRFGWIIGT